jgi:hypothetical protein
MSNQIETPPAPAAKGANVKPEWVRLPSPRERCPITGLSRSTMTELCVPGPANDNTPPVRSVVIRKRNATRGIRLISYDSLTAYLASLGDASR